MASKQPAQVCRNCGAPVRPHERFCSALCRHQHRGTDAHADVSWTEVIKACARPWEREA